LGERRLSSGSDRSCAGVDEGEDARMNLTYDRFMQPIFT
jgi:hypothetical protein